MANPLSNLVNNLSEEMHKIKCKYLHDHKNLEHLELHANHATVLLNTQILKLIYNNRNDKCF